MFIRWLKRKLGFRDPVFRGLVVDPQVLLAARYAVYKNYSDPGLHRMSDSTKRQEAREWTRAYLLEHFLFRNPIRDSMINFCVELEVQRFKQGKNDQT